MSADRVGAPARAWQRMLSGRRLDLLDPSPLDIEISDIAHGLARVARWNGQTSGEHAFSVAQHSVVVEEIAAHIEPGLEPRWRLAGNIELRQRILDRSGNADLRIGQRAVEVEEHGVDGGRSRRDKAHQFAYLAVRSREIFAPSSR